jgi:DOPA 4,5-dioxygenase
MRLQLFLQVFLITPITISKSSHVIQGFHFHTYFFQDNRESKADVQEFRKLVFREITTGFMRNCSMNHLNLKPIGPHPIGSFETCCNISSLGPGVSFFMKNHGKFPILLHPLTESEVLDHSDRAFWMGQKLPLDFSGLSPELHRIDCPIYQNVSIG